MPYPAALVYVSLLTLQLPLSAYWLSVLHIHSRLTTDALAYITVLIKQRDALSVILTGLVSGCKLSEHPGDWESLQTTPLCSYGASKI